MTAGNLERPTPTSLADGESLQRAGRRVLVADDFPDGAETMRTLLQLLGHEVREVHDGEQAVTVAAEFRPDLILMDVSMPRLSGLDAARRIREADWGRSIRIFALTGWSQQGDLERSLIAGCDGHFVKPVSLTDLQAALGG